MTNTNPTNPIDEIMGAAEAFEPQEAPREEPIAPIPYRVQRKFDALVQPTKNTQKQFERAMQNTTGVVDLLRMSELEMMDFHEKKDREQKDKIELMKFQHALKKGYIDEEIQDFYRPEKLIQEQKATIQVNQLVLKQKAELIELRNELKQLRGE